MKTGTNAPCSAESANSARTRFGTWKAIVNADIARRDAEQLAATTSRASPSSAREAGGEREEGGVAGEPAGAARAARARRSPRRYDRRRRSSSMANIASQEKRIHRAERERIENRRRTSQVKTWFRRLEAAVGRTATPRPPTGAPRPRLAHRQGREDGRAAPQQRRPQEGARRAHPLAPLVTQLVHRTFASPLPAPGRLRLRDGRASCRGATSSSARRTRPGSPALPGCPRPRSWPRRPRPRAALTGCPAPRNVPIDHFVILMMENRSFDHYFGWLAGDGGRDAEPALPRPGRRSRCPRGTPRRSAPAACSTRAAATRTPATAGSRAARSCTAASCAQGSGNDEFALSYYNRGELGFIHEAARQYTLYDRFFCSLLASTWPNRYYKWSAQSGGRKDNTPPLETAGNQWETIFDRALGRGLTARYYNSDLPFSAVWGARGRHLDEPDRALLRGLRGGNAAEHRDRRPAVPRRRRRRRAVGRRASARRRASRAGVHGRRGQRLRRSPATTAAGRCSSIYDEWGGFFDHVRPPRVPDDRASAPT